MKTLGYGPLMFVTGEFPLAGSTNQISIWILTPTELHQIRSTSDNPKTGTVLAFPCMSETKKKRNTETTEVNFFHTTAIAFSVRLR
jgi:hypothetical protein